MELLSLDILLLLFVIAFIAGVVDTIAGGGGMITIPVLLFVGLPPVDALSTNKLQSSFGTLSASWYFVKNNFVKLNDIKYMILVAFIGSIFGGWILLQIDASILTDIVPILLIIVGFYFLLSSDKHNSKPKTYFIALPIIVVFAIGVYDGFFGPATGSFFTIAFIYILGCNISQATAKTKVLNATTNIGSLIFFIFYGKISWSIGLIMGGGQVLGGIIGARLVVFRGSKIIRPLIVLISFGMSIKLLMFS